MQPLSCLSKKPFHHPNQHTNAELKLISGHRRRNPNLGLTEFWYRLHRHGYTRHPGSLYRVMKRLGYFSDPKPKKKYLPKQMEQMTYPGQKVQIDVKFVPLACISTPYERYYQFTAINEYSRLRYLEAFEEHSTFSAAAFLVHFQQFFLRHGFPVHTVQTDNGPEFNNRFISHFKDKPKTVAAYYGMHHKLIRPYTPRHNGKVERSHREDVKRFYNSHSFFSFMDFASQLNRYLYRSNHIPMRPLIYLSPIDFLHS